jgi:DNA-binding transcriptional LysR family regulator
MEMHQIRYFVALARTLNFTRAAEECNVTQPALTRAIQALEGELGGDLIRRERQQSHLTELGRRMLPMLQQCYESAHAAQSLARAVKTREVAPLSLAVSRTMNIEVFIPVLSELFRAYPGVELKIKRLATREVGQLLRAGDVELALAGPIADEWERTERWPLFDEPFEVAASLDHALSALDSVAADQLRDARILGLAGCEMADEVFRQLALPGQPVESPHAAETFGDLFALLEANAGIGIVGASAPAAARIRRLPLRDFRLRRPVAVYAVAGRPRSPVATTLLNLLRAAEWPFEGLGLRAAAQ